MANTKAPGISTSIQQKQTAIPITNVILAPYLEKSSREMEEEVGNVVKENPLLEKSAEVAEPKVAVHNPNSDYDNPDPDGAAYDKPLPGERLYHATNRSVNDTYFAPIAVAEESLEEHLMAQVNELNLSDDDTTIAKHIVGNLDTNGWLARTTSGIADDLTFGDDLEVEREDVERVLAVVQQLDPPGIAARTLRECLLIQVRQKQKSAQNDRLALLIDKYLDELGLSHYDKICERMDITREELKTLLAALRKLNPKPGNGYSSGLSDVRRNQIIPEFEVEVEEGKIVVTMPNRIPELVIAEEFSGNAATAALKDKTVKEFYDSANKFIAILKRRQEKLMLVMQSIIKHQTEFFLTGDETLIVPMKYRDIETDTGLDQSTISRVCGGSRGKYVLTPWGTFKLKDFFSGAVSAGANGDETVSSKAVKNALKEIVDAEDKAHPLGDEAIVTLLKEKGYNVARRTVAKYRVKLGIPDSRHRKTL
ncbi:MAG: RNA polymerase factor sigma-54 [Bacteroidales bacterium]|nr:RNA polymerase factor sigma-54 [Bacteroidales bacterium]